MNYNVAVIPGDGIGPEIVTEAVKVLDKVGEVYGHTYLYKELLLGGASIDVHGVPLTDETIVEAVKAAGLEVVEVTYQGEWVSVTARKNG